MPPGQIESVTDDEHVVDGESDELDRHLTDPAARLVEQADGANARGPVRQEPLADRVERLTGVDDVLDDQDVPTSDLVR